MKPSVLWCGFFLFLFCLVLHVLIWRWGRPRQNIAPLLSVFFGPLMLFAIIFVVCFRQASLIDLAAIAILHAALSCTYIQIYPALQAFSPTLVILVLAHKSMPQGVSAEELMGKLNQDFLLGSRIQDLLQEGLARPIDNQLELTPRGLRLIQFFIVFRRLLGLRLGKG